MSNQEETKNEDLPIIIEGKAYPDITKNPLDEISSTAYILGILLGFSVGILPLVGFKNFNLYLVALSVFHFTEFYITAKYNPGKCHSESFIINNGFSYIAAHSVAILECIIELIVFPNWKSFSYSMVHRIIVVVGAICVIMGQATRTIAMYTAGQSFSHVIKTEKNADHKLVTGGIYGFSRHPSYFGFFWWALGTQMLVLNPISFILFAIVLWRFFSARIKFEEQYLIKFFGIKYVNFKKHVPVRIPFMD
ncbi:hypothetical protein Kpol_286p4 [Vanderwaltozyma polyspora DSM 70294]|uniref:Protein-S-isoprenylcysteine O-methyltransferase n=1 Tax=Vanderwaltozyma polyspora (strain ATCC 22028 / DSM 70294 / BCRC 21397 / CBS 2163 / NBRC 10782 / NRRL Y-8283 / UCD 57-17) TaxID=436907 RepID=A7TT98_VANPO|nr:uncharacterized protein Kpol_286p4 [Vanderwaltozyma polyspora DSM 70294]EDO14511.1 hypothetical protein Kpol_286p4 [Vanderwaltozyma polyspora DSM 70294]